MISCAPDDITYRLLIDDGVRLSPSSPSPIECAFCAQPLGLLEGCGCQASIDNRIAYLRKSLAVSEKLLGVKPVRRSA